MDVTLPPTLELTITADDFREAKRYAEDENYCGHCLVATAVRRALAWPHVQVSHDNAYIYDGSRRPTDAGFEDTLLVRYAFRGTQLSELIHWYDQSTDELPAGLLPARFTVSRARI